MSLSLDVRQCRTLRGPHRWGRYKAIEAVVHIAPPAPGLVEARHHALLRVLPALQTVIDNVRGLADGHADHDCFHPLAALALTLQIDAGCDVNVCRVVPTPETDTCFVIVEYSEADVGRLAFEQACSLLTSAEAPDAGTVQAMLQGLRDLDEDQRPGPSTGAILAAATARGIPWRRLTSGSLVQLGWGKWQRRIQAAETDRTGALAEAIAQDKELTRSVLGSHGIPVPQGRPVFDEDDAWRAACEIGSAVVVKPRDGNQGKGVTVNISDKDTIAQAFRTARQVRESVMVERFLPGRDYRLLVIDGRLVAAARREPPLVTGDGIHSVRALVEAINADPRRGEGHGSALTRIPMDAITIATLAAQGIAPEDIIAAGRRVALRNNANLSTGGTATDVTDSVHPRVAAAAIEAAQLVGLDIAGIDIVCEDVTLPLECQGGGIVEVNAAPGLRMHLEPSEGVPRPVGDAIIDGLFKGDSTARIPVVTVTGNNGKTTTVALIAHLLAATGLCVGKTSTHGVQVGERFIDIGDCSGPVSARNVLAHPDVEAAVLETARGGLLREGMGMDACDVAVVTNIGRGDHLGLAWIDTAEQLASVKRIVVDNVRVGSGVAVLNAADPLVVAMAGTCPGEILFFARDAREPALARHRSLGGRAVWVDDGHLILGRATAEHRLPLSEIPLTLGGQVLFQVDNVMAAVAAGWALGLPVPTMAAALASVDASPGSNPGRFNLLHWRGATLIADYGHNTDALDALVQAVTALPLSEGGRRHVMITAAGDRRDEDIRGQTRILGQAFDRVVLFQDACQRGRSEGEVIGLLREGLIDAPKTRSIEEINGEFKAIDKALEDVRAGDVCLILVDQVEEAMAYLLRIIQETP